MEAYDPTYAPAGFGLNNTGAICYFNSFLQALASCTSLTRAILENAGYMCQTRTGAAVLAYVRAFTEAGSGSVAPLSARVLAALTADLAERRPKVVFGGGQESASEALVHLLDMMEPPRLVPLEADGTGAGPWGGSPGNGLGRAQKEAPLAERSASSPITRLFVHRFRCDLHCPGCKSLVSEETDYAVTFNLFHLDRLRAQPSTIQSFSAAVSLQVTAAEDYQCANCLALRRKAAAARGEDPAKVATVKSRAYRVYDLSMIPEVIVCMFNLYDGYGGVRRPRYFPERLEFAAADGRTLAYRLVSQVEHSGSLAGGHYWARALRAGGQVFLLNDTSVSPAAFVPTSSTYMLFYHYTGVE